MTSFEAIAQQVSANMADKREQEVAAIRAARIPTFPGPLLSGRRADTYMYEVIGLLKMAANAASDVDCVVGLISALAVVADPLTIAASDVDCVVGLISALAVVADPLTIAASKVRLTVPTRVGHPAVEAYAALTADERKTQPLNLTLGRVTTDIKKWTQKDGSVPHATDADANAMLAMACFATGRRVTDENEDGFFGSSDPKKTGGRARAIIATSGATTHYVTGARCLTKGELQRIHTAFSNSLAGKLALYSMFAEATVVGLTAAETIVGNQLRLLASEGRGSFDRALAAGLAFADIVKIIPSYNTELMALLRSYQTLSRESREIQMYGFIIYGPSYDTLKVASFAQLATLGGLLAMSTSESAKNIKLPLSGDKLASVERLYEFLEKKAEAEMARAKAEVERMIAAATA